MTYNDKACPCYLGRNCFDYEDLRDLLLVVFVNSCLESTVVLSSTLLVLNLVTVKVSVVCSIIRTIIYFSLSFLLAMIGFLRSDFS